MKRALAAVVLVVLGAWQAPADVRDRVRQLAETGHLSEAERVARSAGPMFAATLGEVLVQRGKLHEADSVLHASLTTDVAGRRQASVQLAELAYGRGDREEALRAARSITASYERESPAWSARDRIAAGRAYEIESSASAPSVRNALAAYDAAVAVDPKNTEARVRTGNLFLQKYNAPDAKASFDDALKIDPKQPRALLGLSRTLEFQHKPGSATQLRAALAINPELVDAHVILARASLEAESYDSARVEAGRALAVDSASMNAWSVLGATAWLTGDSAAYHRAEAAATRLNPRPADFFVELSEAAGRQRRYADGVRLARKALELDSTSVAALGLLGTSEMRAGNFGAARTMLERAFVLDPFNLWHKNTLDLLDELRTFKTIDRGHFRLVAPAQEAELLTTYLFPLLEEGYDSLARRYGYKPTGPIRLEIYDSHADFSVRTVGLAGLGALGVSFGPVLAIDAPSSRSKSEFNWGSVSWHELAHTFTLGLSENRAPRWLGEGLSVLEERRARGEWGARATAEFIGAYNAGLIRPVSLLNAGFVAPRYENETILSYYDASLVCEMIEAEHGAKGLVQLLVAYRDGLSTAAAFERVLGMKPPEMDKHFDTWFRAKFAVPLAAIQGDTSGAISGPFATAMRTGVDYLGRHLADSAQAAFQRAEKLWPDYAGPNSPALILAQMAQTRGDLREALSQVQRVTAVNETAWDANLLEADLREQLGDSAGARIPLERMIWISPYDVSVHQRLAELARRRRDFAYAIRERRAILELHPSDMLEARFQLARALADGGKLAEARGELLQVLEQAPSFERAQALLLELRAAQAHGTPP